MSSVRHPKWLYKIIWYSGVGFIILLALLVILTRLLSPYVDPYRVKLEAMASAALGQPLRIERMDASLAGLQPHVILHGVDLLSRDSRDSIAHFERVRIGLDVVGSLWEQQAAFSQIVIYGAELHVERDEQGRLSMQGLVLNEGEPAPVTPQSNNGPSAQDELAEWLMRQGKLAVRDSILHWHDDLSGQEHTFRPVDIELLNEGDKHVLHLAAKLPQALGKHMEVALDIKGHLLQPSQWQGDLYLHLKDVKPALLLDGRSLQGVHLAEGGLDLQLWADWDREELQSVQGKLKGQALRLVNQAGDGEDIHKMGGRFHWYREQTGSVLDVGNLQIQTSQGQSGPTRLQWQQRGQQHIVQLDTLQIEVFRQAFLLTTISEPLRESLAALQPRGELRTLRFNYFEGGHYAAQGDVVGYQQDAWQQLPGLQALNSAFTVENGNAQFSINSQGMVLQMPKVFREQVVIYSLQGLLQLEPQEQGRWRLRARNLSLHSPDLQQATVDMELQVGGGRPPWIDLQGRFEKGRATAVPRYLPYAIMGEGSQEWLNKAFVQGEVASGRVSLRGSLDRFPWRNGQGLFEVALRARGVELDYYPGWPRINKINGDILFRGPGMWITAEQGVMYDAAIGITKVVIPDFSKPRLDIAGQVQASASDVLRLLRESPLSEYLGEALQPFGAQGETALQLHLAIPLDAEQPPLKVEGEAELQGWEVDLAGQLQLQALKGRLNFADTAFSASDLQALVFGEPTHIEVRTAEQGGRRTIFTARGSASSETIKSELHYPFIDHMYGHTDWQARVDVPHQSHGEVGLRIQSRLKGMALALPSPLEKAAADEESFDLFYALSGARKNRLDISLGQRFSAALQLSEDMHGLKGGDLYFGPHIEVLELGPRLYIHGNVEEARVSDWLDVLLPVFNQLSQKGPRSEEVAAQEAEPLPVLEHEKTAMIPVEVRMNRLHLLEEDSTTEQEQEGENPSDKDLKDLDILPRVSIVVEDLRYGEMLLGKLQMEGEVLPDQIYVDPIKLQGPNMQLEGRASWWQQDREVSTVELRIKTDNIGKMMKDLNFASVIREGKTRINTEVYWMDQPQNFAKEKLNGELRVQIDEGRIDEVPAGAGKLLGLLSIQALPRRLFLDFSDLFNSGMEFESIQGHIVISDGVAETRKLVMDSLAAEVNVSGTTDFANETIDQTVTVIPNVEDSITITSGLVYGPQVALAVLAMQKLLGDGIDEVSKIEYHVGGSWQDPKIKKVKDEISEKERLEREKLLQRLMEDS